MGIRFLCPTCGHKLNVKSFLAGKRGVCPQCGSALDIPLDSQVNRDGTPIDGDNPSDTGGASGIDFASPAEASPLPPTAQPVAGTPHGTSHGTPHGGPMATPVSHTSPTGSGAPMVGPSGVGSSSPQVPLASPVRPVSPAPRSVPVQPAVPMRQGTPVHSAGPGQPAEPVAPAPADPIDEAPDAVWYVRPQSGGQYGPAKGDVMRKWIGEGRVAADSLVWREGWDDWMNASQVFPSLGGGLQPPAQSPVAPNPSAYGYSSPAPITKPSPAYAMRPRRRSSNTLAVAAVVVLGLMAVVLMAIFVIVVRN